MGHITINLFLLLVSVLSESSQFGKSHTKCCNRDQAVTFHFDIVNKLIRLRLSSYIDAIKLLYSQITAASGDLSSHFVCS